MLNKYNTFEFHQIWDSADEFLADYKTINPMKKMSEQGAVALFYLLYTRYAYNPIANEGPDVFKLKFFALLFQYGPTWEKRLEIQDKLRALSEEELRAGSKTIMNTALNPETRPKTSELTELTYINQQNTSGTKKSAIKAYADLWEILKVDVTEEIIKKFNVLFIPVLLPQRTKIFVTEEEE